MAASLRRIVQDAIDIAIGERGEIGVQVAAIWTASCYPLVGGLADGTIGWEVDGDTLFPVFSNIKAMTAVALHIQGERGQMTTTSRWSSTGPNLASMANTKGRCSIR